jgi:hypothetical protein
MDMSSKYKSYYDKKQTMGIWPRQAVSDLTKIDRQVYMHSKQKRDKNDSAGIRTRVERNVLVASAHGTPTLLNHPLSLEI